ncbi:hypothetical protein AWW66_04420 [Micromonospora rosaria]|uniref:Secreted protein n=1 Tax=Micromonospora rosaria TaxID=47874 RepID=A0A136PYB6_9ACTN|nr:hypothetical protein [Micromonospora rosaria]KXK63186.1 hypothetical protein AWW66_04420 [Micromonospora rosaria]
MAKFFSRRSAAVALSALALTLGGGGVAAAQSTSLKAPLDSVQPAAPGVSGGQPQVTAAEAREAKAALKKSVGTNAVPGSTSYALVNGAGGYIRGYDAVSSKKYGPGQYQVVFNRNVVRGGYVATIGTNTECCVPPAGQVSVAPRLGTPNAVFVQTYTSAGVPADLPFHLAIFTY